MRTRPKTMLLALLVATAVAFAPLTLAQAADARPVLLTPKSGAVLKRGSRPTFKVRDRDPNARRYRVYLTIPRSKKRDRRGDLVRSKRYSTFSSMTRRGRFGFVYRPPAYSFPTWFMQAPGRYYWQAFHIDCRVKGCHVHSRIGTFRVR